jgi:hypothetical protein
MTRRIKKHFWYYTGLGIAQIIGLYIVWITAYSKQLQMLAVVMMTCFYVGWAIMHHILHHDLSVKIVIEYVLIGILGMSMTLLLIA